MIMVRVIINFFVNLILNSVLPHFCEYLSIFISFLFLFSFLDADNTTDDASEAKSEVAHSPEKVAEYHSQESEVTFQFDHGTRFLFPLRYVILFSNILRLTFYEHLSESFFHFQP